MTKLLVLGSSNIDHVVQVPRFPQPGETLAGSDYQVHFGGKGANQAVAAARALGCVTHYDKNSHDKDGRNKGSVEFITCLGSDPLGLQLKQALISDGISAQGISCSAELPSGVAMIQVNAQGENQIVLAAGANAALDSQHIKQHAGLFESASLLLMQLETPLEGVVQAAAIAKANQIAVALNPAPAAELPTSLYPLLDWITPNQTEVELLSGIAIIDQHSADQASRWFHQQGVTNVMITLGAEGVWISQQSSDQKIAGQKIAGFKVEVVDTVAAGDTFNGAFFIRLLQGDSIEAAARFAHAAAALCVSKAGAQSSIPKLTDVNEFLESAK
ncbi:ribokinase [Pelagibaculum spongiae]|uniref:Ribokinase n=1 Tax=Pelagibaculum spongiae TaxID=2080658 RepID=A0A2V1H4T5_9GAMM|nr:ribokinase [Pelagibaculum spongiae]PVZ72238.1 ribokinase [Pelagibaculum spongiae]